MAPLNIKGVTPTASFTTDYEDIDLTTLSDLWKFDGIRLAGRVSGSNLSRVADSSLSRSHRRRHGALHASG